MSKAHIVRQGEHASAIARQYGFGDYRSLWDHPQNAGLKTKRQNPNVLFPGDTLHIPDKQGREEPCPTGQSHRFVARKQKLILRFVIKDIEGQPVANDACELEVEGKKYNLNSDPNGQIEAEIPVTAQNASLRVRDSVIPAKIGHLDPVQEESGWRARLTNLGYYRGPQEPVDAMELRSAIEEFQCDHGLKVTGECDPGTQAKLGEVHGC